MLKAPVPVTAETVARVTTRARRQVEDFLVRARQLAEDAKRTERLTLQLCPLCFYVNSVRISGAAMTTQPCPS